MKGLKLSNPSSATPRTTRIVLLTALVVLLLILVVISVTAVLLYYFYRQETIWDMYFRFIPVFSSISLLAVLLSVPALMAFLRAYRRGSTFLTRSFLEMIAGILLSIALVLSLGIPVFFLLEGAGPDVAMRAAVYGLQNFGKIFLFFIPVLISFPLALKYLDRNQKIPYISLLQISFIVFAMLRNLIATPLLQSGDLPLRLFYVLLLSPIALTAVWLLISPNVILSSVKTKRVTDRGFLELVDELKRMAGITAPFEVYSAPAVEGFARILGIRKPILLVSEDLVKSRGSQSNMIKPIIMHELLHARNLDTLSHALSVTAYRSMMVCGMLSLFLFILISELGRDKSVMNYWSQVLVLNSLLIFAIEKWCYRLREVQVDLAVQDMNLDIAGLLKIISIPKKRKFGLFGSVTPERIRFLKEPYRAFMPSCPEGFVMAVISIHFFVVCHVLHHQFSQHDTEFRRICSVPDWRNVHCLLPPFQTTVTGTRCSGIESQSEAQD